MSSMVPSGVLEADVIAKVNTTRGADAARVC